MVLLGGGGPFKRQVLTGREVGHWGVTPSFETWGGKVLIHMQLKLALNTQSFCFRLIAGITDVQEAGWEDYTGDASKMAQLARYLLLYQSEHLVDPWTHSGTRGLA